MIISLVLFIALFTDDVLSKYFKSDAAFQMMSVDKAFAKLTVNESLYAHFLAKASWEGHFIGMMQASPESSLIYILLDKILRLKPSVTDLRPHLKTKHGFTDAEVDALYIYTAAFLSSAGNYGGFTNDKFIPDVPEKKLKSIAEEVLKKDLQFFEKHCIKPMLDFSKGKRVLAFPPNGITSYYSSNCDEKDAKLVAQFHESQQIEGYNTRAFKTLARNKSDVDVYEIRFASLLPTENRSNRRGALKNVLGTTHTFKGKQFRFTRGDYSTLMAPLIKNLEQASLVALNSRERRMLESYVHHFRSGSLEDHKNASKRWIKDVNPVIESYLGFVENYRDPAGFKSEFYAFVSVVDKESSLKMADLVNKAERIINSAMPWPAHFNKDKYLSPDFSSLDLIAFSGSKLYAGINLPNYGDIRQNIGFKNVQFLNIGGKDKSKSAKRPFSKEDTVLYNKYNVEAYSMIVSLHELLGHGTGKQFVVSGDGKFNFDRKSRNPITNLTIASWYKAGETYDSVFGSIASSYEECRAETAAIYLTLRDDVVRIFGYYDKTTEEARYATWITMILYSISSITSFNVEGQKWQAAHAQARFVILRILLEKAKGLITIDMTSPAVDREVGYLVTVRRDLIQSVGKQALSDFLTRLQVYKSTADVTRAKEMFDHYSKLDNSAVDFLKLRGIILRNAAKVKNTFTIQPNTFLNGTKVTLKNYPETLDGMLTSWVERYSDVEARYKALRRLYEKDMAYFPVP